MRLDAGPRGQEGKPASDAKSSEDLLTVISANLEELYDAEDNARVEDLKSFAKRVLEVVPSIPDVLLLQEVLARGAEVVAKTLSELTGKSVRVAVKPGVTPFSRESATQETVRDTAILLNSETMKVKKAGGFVATRQDPKDDAADAPRNKVKEHAYMLATHLPSRVDAALMSIHLIPNRWLASKEIGYRLRGLWVKELFEFLEKKYPPRKHQIQVLAGDFNNDRTDGRRETIDAEVYPFWTVLTKEHGLDDAVFRIHGGSDKEIREQNRRGDKDGRRIDYIFTDCKVGDASHDTDYGGKSEEPGFYSDHRLLWAVLILPKGAPRKKS